MTTYTLEIVDTSTKTRGSSTLVHFAIKISQEHSYVFFDRTIFTREEWVSTHEYSVHHWYYVKRIFLNGFSLLPGTTVKFPTRELLDEYIEQGMGLKIQR
jgi:hypothetical protein